MYRTPMQPGEAMGDVVQSLCKATAHWFAYQKAVGFEHVSEALFIIPLAKCLAAKGYNLRTEADTTEYGVGTPGLFNYDAIAKSADGTTIFLEIKYLRENFNVNRCLIDVLKLALPPGEAFQRLLIVAGEAAIIKQFSLKTEYSLDRLENLAKFDQAFGRFLKKFNDEESSHTPICVWPSVSIEADGKMVQAWSVSRK